MIAVWSKFVRRAADWIDHDRVSEGPPPQSLSDFVRWALAGAWPVIFLGAFVSSLTGASEVLSMYLLGVIVDIAASGDPVGPHWATFALAAFLMVGFRPALYGFNSAFQSVILGPNLFKLVLSRLHRWTLGQAVTFFDNDFAGRIAQKQNQTARSLTEIIIETVNAIIFGLSSVLGAAILVVAVDWRILVLLGLWFVVYGAYVSFFLPRIRKLSKARAAAQAMVTGQVVDTITNIKTVKLFARSSHEDGAALGAMTNLRDRAIDFGEVSSFFRFGLIFLAGTLPVLLVGAGFVLPGVSAGEIAAMGAVSIRLAQMSGWISFTLMQIYSHVGEVEDGMRTLTPAHTLTDSPEATDLAASSASISFEGVSFAYGRTHGGVEGIDLHIAKGERVGIVGASGAGKSTLVSLLLRLYDAETGQVKIGGSDVSTVTQESLRRQIAMVTQETAMFNRSARDNILYGRPDASEDELIAATKQAEAHDFITGLEDHNGRTGYDAYLGERGVKLSGGQRQRIALARAILKDAPILILDEATSALDSEVEAEIQAALETVMLGKTVLAIAHRLSTLAQMNRIVVLDEGRIVETGNHDELLAAGGLYARYWQRQSGGFIKFTEAAE